MPIIEVNHVTKEYHLGALHSLKQSAQHALARLRGESVPQRPPFKALDDVDFTVEEGEVLGIIGTNGAGKSTLLKMLARISVPTRGSVKVHGKVAPLIEVGAGLVGDLTGRENVYLNGAILGIPKAEIARKFDEIVAFAELEEFIDTPIKRYSSGMSVRLGFAIATSVDADILIVDEVLAVGDLAFQRKCFDRMEDMIKRQGKTVLLVSHNIRQVERLCSRVILLDHGKILKNGKPARVCNLFYTRSDEQIKHNLAAANMARTAARNETSGEVQLLNVSILDEDGIPTDKITANTDLTVVLEYLAHKELINPVFGVGVHTTDFLYLATHHSDKQIHLPKIAPGKFKMLCKITHFPFLPGAYSLRVGIAVGEMASTAFYAENVFQFQVVIEDEKRTEAMREGFVDLDAEWEAPIEPACVTDENNLDASIHAETGKARKQA